MSGEEGGPNVVSAVSGRAAKRDSTKASMLHAGFNGDRRADTVLMYSDAVAALFGLKLSARLHSRCIPLSLCGTFSHSTLILQLLLHSLLES